MGFQTRSSRISIFILLFALLSFACSTPSWFPFFKKGPPHQAKIKELLDKEVVIIDRQEYVKVTNPKAREAVGEPKYLYIPVNEYLSKKEIYTTSVASVDLPQQEGSLLEKSSVSTTETEIASVSVSKPLPYLKKKVVVAYFEDRTANADDRLGDWVAEKLVKDLERRSLGVLFADYSVVREFLEKRGTSQNDLEVPGVLSLLNEVFGIHAVVVGSLSGPYVFTTRTVTDQEGTATAVIRLEVKVIETLTGRVVKTFSSHNPTLATKEKGSFSDEKAKLKAIDLTISDLSRSLSRELDTLDWSCRVVKVEAEEYYLNAGKVTGLKLGDRLDVFRPGEPGTGSSPKGQIQISGFLGMDASVGKIVDGKKPEVNDVLRLGSRRGT